MSSASHAVFLFAFLEAKLVEKMRSIEFASFGWYHPHCLGQQAWTLGFTHSQATLQLG